MTEAPTIRSIPKKLKNLKEGRIRIRACLQTGDVVNRNKRKYSKSLIESGVANVKPRINEGSLLGELDHPVASNANSVARQVTVLFKEASHKFCEIGWDGNKLVSVLETLRTPNGEILRNLAEDGIPVGFSFRGISNLIKSQLVSCLYKDL